MTWLLVPLFLAYVATVTLGTTGEERSWVWDLGFCVAAVACAGVAIVIVATLP